MIEQRTTPYRAPRLVNTLYTPSTYQYVYFQDFDNKDIEFRVRAPSNVHILFQGKEIEKELAICGIGGITEVRSSAQGSVIASTDTLTLLPSENSIRITWTSEDRTFKINVNGTEWMAQLSAGGKINPFTKVSFSTSADVTGIFYLNDSDMGTDYGYGDFNTTVKKPLNNTKKVTFDPEPESIVAPPPEPEVDTNTSTTEEATEPEPTEEPPKPARKTRGRKKKAV